MRKPCRWPGCIRLVGRKERYCPEHRALLSREDAKSRGTAAQRGYGARWRKLRLMVLKERPVCADPFGVHRERGEIALATEVDHIIPRHLGGDDSFENLQPLCRSCHARKTAQEREGRGVQILGAGEDETGARPRGRRRENRKNSPGPREGRE